MTWRFLLKERADDQDQWVLARLTSPGVLQFLCTTGDNIILACTGWAIMQKFGVVLLKNFTPPSQKNFLVNRLVRGPSQGTDPPFSGVQRVVFTLLGFHECFLRSLIKNKYEVHPVKKDNTNQEFIAKE